MLGKVDKAVVCRFHGLLPLGAVLRRTEKISAHAARGHTTGVLKTMAYRGVRSVCCFIIFWEEKQNGKNVCRGEKSFGEDTGGRLG